MDQAECWTLLIKEILYSYLQIAIHINLYYTSTEATNTCCFHLLDLTNYIALFWVIYCFVCFEDVWSLIFYVIHKTLCNSGISLTIKAFPKSPFQKFSILLVLLLERTNFQNLPLAWLVASLSVVCGIRSITEPTWGMLGNWAKE